MPTTVLLIDDDHQFRPFVRLALERGGHSAREAGDGAEGLRAYRREPADGAVCDVFMPGLGALEALRRLRRLDPAVKVVMMSAGGEGPLGAALTLGAAAILRKPFGLADLLKAVQEALAG